MPSSRYLALATSHTFLLLLAARSAVGQVRVPLDYSVPQGCPTEADFVAAVSARGALFSGDRALARARGIDVSVARDAAGFVGSMHLQTPNGSSDTRQVHDSECAQVVQGLAVVTAIALGGQVETAPDPALAATDAQSVVASNTLSTEDAGVDAQKLTAPAAARTAATPRLRGSSFTPIESKEVPAGTLRFDHVRSYTLAGGAMVGLIPDVVLPRFDFTGSLASFVTPPSDSSYLIAPILQVRWSLLGPVTRASSDGFDTRALGLQAGVSSCSAINYDTQGFVLLLCGEFGVGLIKLTTTDPAGREVQAKDDGFGSAGLTVDTQYNISSLLHVGLRLGGQIQFGVSAERPDGSVLFESSLFGGYASLGLGVHF